MGIQVKQIDVYGLEARLKKDDKEAMNYINKLKEAYERQRDLTNMAIAKLKRYAEKYGNIE
jgi:hypothetical protein